MKKVFFGPGSSVWQNLYLDIKNNPDFEYCDFSKKFSRIKNILLSYRLNKYLPHFIRKYIYIYILKYDFLKISRNEQVLFIFTNGYEMCADNIWYQFCIFLKKRYKNAKFALHQYEALSGRDEQYVRFIRNFFDICLTFSRLDSEKYNIKYYGPVCEYGAIKPTEGEGEESDVFYAGCKSGFGRAKKVLEIFRYYSDIGLKCNFYIYDFTKEEKEKILFDFGIKIHNEIENIKHFTYKRSKFNFTYLSYQKSLNYINRTKCILELIWPVDLASCTARLAQAVNYNKKLITNSITVTKEPFYHRENILVLNKDNESTEDIRNFLNLKMVRYEEKFTATNLCKYIEEELRSHPMEE